VTRLEKVMEKKEELKKLLLEDYCPSDFGIEDRHDREKYCDPATRNCEACWNEETDLQEEEAVKLLKGGVDVWSTALELRMG
jgi:hypothetical protein